MILHAACWNVIHAPCCWKKCRRASSPMGDWFGFNSPSSSWALEWDDEWLVSCWTRLPELAGVLDCWGRPFKMSWPVGNSMASTWFPPSPAANPVSSSPFTGIVPMFLKVAVQQKCGGKFNLILTYKTFAQSLALLIESVAFTAHPQTDVF